ncbi:MAG: rRNA maturation RNase YbeY [Ferrimicrobium sp.]
MTDKVEGIEVYLADEQSLALDLSLLRYLATAVIAAEGIKGPAELSMLLVDRDSISTLNRRFRNVPGPTDVLSFTLDDEEGAAWQAAPSAPEGIDPSSDTSVRPRLLGDVVICPEVAQESALEHRGDRGHDGSIMDEIALLVVHGILHIRGMDHEEAAEAQEMESKEAAYLREFYQPRRNKVVQSSENGDS